MFLLALSFLNTVIQYLEWSFEKGTEVINAVLSVFRPRYYILFKGSPVAYEANTVSPFATGSRPAGWVYSPTDKAFFGWHHSLFGSIHNPFNEVHSIPILSLEIIERETGRVQYDLTEFIESMHIRRASEDVAEARNPSIAELVAAWTTRSHVVVDPERFFVRFMDTEANEVETGIDNMRPLNPSRMLEIHRDAGRNERAGEGTAEEAKEAKED